MKLCPNCKSYELSFWDKFGLDNYLPSRCPKCNELYVNSTAAALLWATSSMVYVFAVLFVLYEKSFVLALGLASMAIPAFVLFVKPIPYSTFKPYGRRSWWKNLLIFVLLPLLLISAVMYLFLVFRVGM